MNTTQSATAQCGTCTYWNQHAEQLGECRRHAPQTVAFTVDQSVKFESRFPATTAADWCGDYNPRR